MSSIADLERADDLISSLLLMDKGEMMCDGFDPQNSVAAIGVRSIHALVGVNQLIRMNPVLHEHLLGYPNGLLMQVLKESIRVLVEEVGGYRENDLLIQYNIHDIE